MKTKLLGKNSVEALNDLEIMGQLFVIEEKFEEAEKVYCEVLPGLKAQLGEMHPKVAITLHHLGIL